ncbi:hypothetical protein YC2023_077572 [Brassica napus]
MHPRVVAIVSTVARVFSRTFLVEPAILAVGELAPPGYSTASSISIFYSPEHQSMLHEGNCDAPNFDTN